VTQVRQFTGGQAAVTDLTYEANGNIHSVTGPANDAGQRYQLDYAYDAAVATYPVSITDSFGYESTASYDYRFGKPLSTTDLNGNSITYAYDAMGRTTTVVGPYETADKPTIAFEYHPFVDVAEGAAPFISWAKTRHFDKDADGNAKDTIDTVLFTDGLKRVLQTKKDAAVAAPGAAPVDKMIVSGRVVFDGLGRTVEQYYPVTEVKSANNGQFNDSFDTETPTTMVYDVMDRNLTTTIPDGTTTSLEYGFGTDRTGATQFRTLVTDANGNRKETFRDARELITAVKEFANNETLWTSYDYDALKQIVQVEDHAHNKTLVNYDNFGRRTLIDNPDTGITQMAYDLASNLTTKTTAKGDVITYAYDYSRLKSISYPRYVGNNVTYEYGAAGTKGNGKNQVGRIIKVTHAAGTESREYGKLGETTKEVFTVTAAQGGKSPTYVTEHSFDTFGRLLNLKLPGGEVIRHEYDSGGNIARITGMVDGKAYNYLDKLHYDKFEQRLYMKLGNGVETNYTYNAKNRRLTTLASHSPNPRVGDFQNLNYGYDNVGNILSLKNDVPIPSGGTIGGPAEQHFEYDELYRLVKAEGVFTGSQTREERYSLNMAYDGIHNITHKTQVHTVGKPGSTGRTVRATTYDWAYAYTGPQPHAPSQIGTRAYTYDANGNQAGYTSTVSGTRRAIDWDEENRIMAIHDPGNTGSYLYDDQGERKIKRGRYGETVYVNQFFTVRNGALATEHMYAGTTRIVSKLMPGQPIGYKNGDTGVTTNATGTDILSTSSGGVASVTYNGTTITSSGTTTTNNGNGANGEFPGQGLEHRSDRANEVARNTEKNKHLNGGVPGGTHGSGNSNAGGNGSNSGNSGGNGNGNGSGNNGGGNSGGGNGGNNGNGGGSGNGGGFGQGTEFLFFYHPDHLGSTSYVTDGEAKLYEHMEYFPFGETWVSEANNNWKTPYLFTSKELDSDTQLYYYGARYYDPRTSVWQSADPILGQYLQSKSKNGGVFNSLNLNLYANSYQNPVLYRDPDGRSPDDAPQPLTSQELRRMARDAGLATGTGPNFNRQVGRTFQDTARASTGGGENYVSFPSEARRAATSGKRRGAQPDQVGPLNITDLDTGNTRSFPNLTFKEAKAKSGSISLSYENYQALGMIDYLHNQASREGAPFGVLVFQTTADTRIGRSVLNHATESGVVVMQSTALAIKNPTTGQSLITFGPPVVLNQEVFESLPVPQPVPSSPGFTTPVPLQRNGWTGINGR